MTTFVVDTKVNDEYPTKFDAYIPSQDWLQGSHQELPDTYEAGKWAGLFAAAWDAYSSHRHLVLRPEDFWLVIQQQLGLYVTNHAEELRDKFVNFKDKETIEIQVGNTFDGVPQRLAREVQKRMKTPEVVDWIMPQFSTTTAVDQVCFAVQVMSTMSKYFSFSCCIMCGLPQVTLEGTLEDWKALRKKATRLAEYDVDGKMKQYCVDVDSVLVRLVETFEAAVKGQPIDTAWWNAIINMNSGGSGPSYMDGWLIKMILYDIHGRYRKERMESTDMPAGITSVDFTLVDLGGEEHKAQFHSGSSLVHIADHKVRPLIHWHLTCPTMPQLSQRREVIYNLTPHNIDLYDKTRTRLVRQIRSHYALEVQVLSDIHVESMGELDGIPLVAPMEKKPAFHFMDKHLLLRLNKHYVNIICTRMVAEAVVANFPEFTGYVMYPFCSREKDRIYELVVVHEPARFKPGSKWGSGSKWGPSGF